MKTFNQSVIFIFIVALAFTACTSLKFMSFEDDKRLAVKTIEQFHKLYNEENYVEIFNSAHEDAKANKSKEKLTAVLSEFFEYSGKHQNSELVYSKVEIINTKERKVELVFKSKYEKGYRNESFLIITNDREGKLHSIGELTDEEVKQLKK